MMHQQDAEAPEPHSYPKQVGEQIRPQELFAIEQQSDDRREHARDAGQQRVPLPPANLRGHWIGCCHFTAPGAFPAEAPCTSSALAPSAAVGFGVSGFLSSSPLIAAGTASNGAASLN